MADLQIGDVAREAGVPVSTIRYYERIGLLTATARSEGGYRLYRAHAVDEVRFNRGRTGDADSLRRDCVRSLSRLPSGTAHDYWASLRQFGQGVFF